MYVVDNKDTKFYDRISHALAGRGIDCISTSALEERNELKPFGSFIKVVERSFDCTKDQDLLGFVKKIKFKKVFLVKYGCANFNYVRQFNGAITVLELPTKLNDNIVFGCEAGNTTVTCIFLKIKYLNSLL